MKGKPSRRRAAAENRFRNQLGDASVLLVRAAALLREHTARGKLGDKANAAFMHALKGHYALSAALDLLDGKECPF